MFAVQSHEPHLDSPEIYFNWVGSSLTQKHWTRLEMLARDKHVSLLRALINYGRKKFTILGIDEVQYAVLPSP